MNGNRLKDARIRLGHTQESFAEIMGTDARTIWRWESNKNDPSGDIIAKLAQVLEVSADYLLGVTDDPTPIRAGAKLSPQENAIINAIRRGDKMEALKVIISDKDTV